MKKRSATFLLKNYAFLVVSLVSAAGAWFCYYNTLKYRNDQQHLLTSISTAIHNELDKVDSHFEKISPAVSEFPQLYEKRKGSPYPFYRYENGRLTFWSDFNFIPNLRDVNENFKVKLAAKDESFHLLVKYSPDANTEVIYAIPLVVKYPIVNEYLKSRANTRVFASGNFEISRTKQEEFSPISIASSQEPLFFVKLSPGYGSMNTSQHILVNGFAIISIAFFMIFFWKRSRMLLKRSQHAKAFLWLFSGSVVLRAAMIAVNYPFLVFPNELFNPRNYASSFVNPSLGDLLLNILSLFILTAFLFRHYSKIKAIKRFVSGNGRSGKLISSLLIFLSLGLLSLFFLLVSSLNLHSQWSLDISRELNFHFLKIISYLLVITGGLIYFFLSHIIFRLIIHKYKHSRNELAAIFLAGTVAFVGIAIADNWDFVLVSIVNTIYFFALYIFNFPQYLRRIQYLTFVYFFVASLPLCIVGAYSIYRYQLKKLVQEKDKLAGQLLVDNDVLTEYLLNEAADQIASDVFIQNRILNPYLSNVNIEQRVQQVYLNNQLEKYDVNTHLFNSRGKPIDESTFNLNDLLKEYEKFKIDSSLYFINQYIANSLKRYLKVIEIKRYSRVAGYVLIDLKLKRIIPTSVYPMLLIDNRYSGPDISTDYSYGIYENGRLIFNLGDYHYAERLRGNNDISQAGRKQGNLHEGMLHFSVKDENNRTYLIALKAYPLQNVFSNFSFLLVLFLGAILAALVAITAYFKIKGVQQNYASRIQLFLNAAFLTPLMIISVSAVSVIVKSYDDNLEIENLEQAANISARISESLNTFLKKAMSREELSERVNGISRLAEIDINVFGNNGRLLATSQPLIYENDLLGELINPEAYLHIVYNNAGGMALNENIGRLSYKNTYMPIKSSESGQRIGILSLPYFDVREELEENVISVLTNVLNIFTVIFLVFLVLSYLASTWLTFPLRLITHKIRKTSLLNTNEPLEWNSDDEIGLMVGEYNTMLLNLEESKKALAKSEKESAWREIARQVAHEIKNPLTPMQLTLQHMKRTLHEDQIDKEKRIRQIDALLHQVSTLSDIATSFSTFAKMPVPQKDVFELAELVKDTIAIYDKSDTLVIESKIEEQQFWIDADKKWIGQAISNVLINAIHAVENKQEKLVSVALVARGRQKTLLTIADNGRGISEEIRNKIFMPDFSTKQGGSGIGLAIAKRAIEHAGGEIWFESKPDNGTTFYIELPLVK